METYNIPSWLFPLLSAVGSAFGAWVAVKVTLARLEERLADVRTRVTRHARRLAVHNDDLLTHDFEIGQAFTKLELARTSRQRLRDRLMDSDED